jgi:glycosyltransferase involved in cell wall biosynthesis
MALISVIVPTCNRPDQLRDALESVRRQSFDDFAVVVVDDHSDDQEETRRVVDSMADRRFSSIYLDRRMGPGGARNRALPYCTGEYLSFLDDDDLMRPEKLKIHVGALQTQPEVAMIYSDEFVVQPDGRIPEFPLRGGRRLPSGHIARDFFMWSFIGTMTVSLRKSAFEEAGGFDESLIWNEDDDLWFRVMMKHRVLFSDYPAGIRRRHGANMSRNREEMVLSQFRCIEKYMTLYPDFVVANVQAVDLRVREIWRAYRAGKVRNYRFPSRAVLSAYLGLRRRLPAPSASPRETL